jgi:Rrf2 family iron-sulfur cluster assembly transcriptional regulator
MNLGIIMKEYLATTSLGDLIRKTKETETEAGISSESSNEASGIMTSAIRNPVGEINQ